MAPPSCKIPVMMITLRHEEKIDIRLPDGRIIVVYSSGRAAVMPAAAMKKEAPDTDLLTVSEARAILKLGHTTLYRLLSSKHGRPVLASKWIPGKGRVIRREDLAKLIAEGRPK